MRTVAAVCQAESFGPFGESTILVIDEKLILLIVPFNITAVAHIDVEPSVTIDIHHAHASRPGTLPGNSSLFGYIFKLPITLIEIKAVRHLIAGKVYVCPPIAVDIPQRYSASIVKISIGKNIESFVINQLVLKIHSRLAAFQLLEECCFSLPALRAFLTTGCPEAPH